MRSKPKIFQARAGQKSEAVESARDLIRLHSDLERTLKALSSASRPTCVEPPIDVVKLIARLADAKRRLEQRISRLVPVEATPVRSRGSRS